MSANLGAYSELSDTLGRKSAFVERLADDVRLFSLNALLAAARLTEGAALEAVADLMRARSDAATPVIRALEVNGRVEAARAADADAVQTLFQTIGKQVGEAQEEIKDFDEVSVLIRRRDERTEREVRESAGRVESVVAALAG